MRRSSQFAVLANRHNVTVRANRHRSSSYEVERLAEGQCPATDAGSVRNLGAPEIAFPLEVSGRYQIGPPKPLRFLL